MFFSIFKRNVIKVLKLIRPFVPVTSQIIKASVLVTVFVTLVTYTNTLILLQILPFFSNHVTYLARRRNKEPISNLVIILVVLERTNLLGVYTQPDSQITFHRYAVHLIMPKASLLRGIFLKIWGASFIMYIFCVMVRHQRHQRHQAPTAGKNISPTLVETSWACNPADLDNFDA